MIAPENEDILSAEFLRLAGELMLKLSTDRAAEAVSFFEQAVRAAQQVKLPMLELRAAAGLCRALRHGDDAERGRRLLGEVYAKFTEGFTTADLLDAKSCWGRTRRSPRDDPPRVAARSAPLAGIAFPLDTVAAKQPALTPNGTRRGLLPAALLSHCTNLRGSPRGACYRAIGTRQRAGKQRDCDGRGAATQTSQANGILALPSRRREMAVRRGVLRDPQDGCANCWRRSRCSGQGASTFCGTQVRGSWSAAFALVATISTAILRVSKDAPSRTCFASKPAAEHPVRTRAAALWPRARAAPRAPRSRCFPQRCRSSDSKAAGSRACRILFGVNAGCFAATVVKGKASADRRQCGAATPC